MKNYNTLNQYLFHLADNSLILGHRNSEWCGHGPILEQDIAITNISLDLIGQARNFYQYAAKRKGDGTTEDTLAYLRDNREFRNCLLVEQPNGDWGKTMLRQFFISTFQFFQYAQLEQCKDATIAAISTKALKEVTYHLRWSGEWVIRLGDGTEESHSRILNAVEELWPFTGELFVPTSYEMEVAKMGKGTDPSTLQADWQKKIEEIFHEATIPLPPPGTWMQSGGKEGKHTEYLGFILADLQFMQRAYPNAEW
jgi:ring-1,2-phenylacetyl-CoA epoxidase subunit PaaC